VTSRTAKVGLHSIFAIRHCVAVLKYLVCQSHMSLT